MAMRRVAALNCQGFSGRSWTYPLAGKTKAEKRQILKRTSYRDYLINICCCSEEVARCFPDSTDMALPSTAPLIVSAQAASATLLGQTSSNVTTYGVIVSVTEQAYTNAPPVRSYYQLPVSVYAGVAPRAMDRPSDT